MNGDAQRLRGGSIAMGHEKIDNPGPMVFEDLNEWALGQPPSHSYLTLATVVAIFARLGFVDLQRAPAYFLAVEFLDRRSAFFLG